MKYWLMVGATCLLAAGPAQAEPMRLDAAELDAVTVAPIALDDLIITLGGLGDYGIDNTRTSNLAIGNDESRGTIPAAAEGSDGESGNNDEPERRSAATAQSHDPASHNQLAATTEPAAGSNTTVAASDSRLAAAMEPAAGNATTRTASDSRLAATVEPAAGNHTTRTASDSRLAASIEPAAGNPTTGIAGGRHNQSSTSFVADLRNNTIGVGSSSIDRLLGSVGTATGNDLLGHFRGSHGF